jgi:hypothetical protein
MDVERIEMERQQARTLYREYRKHQHYSQPVDDEIRRTYQALGQGRVVIKALESIRLAGLGDNGLPKLAIIRADQRQCDCVVSWNGGAQFNAAGAAARRTRKTLIELPAGTFTVPAVNPSRLWESTRRGQAIVPLVPITVRPKRAIENYSILWEADWKDVPIDPMLLRRIGKGDLWVVVAAWDLTPVERAALAARVRA